MNTLLLLFCCFAAAAAAPACTWSAAQPGFVSGWPASTGRVRFPTLALAQQNCIATQDCFAVTENTGAYELRAGTAVEKSGSGETSWLLQNAAACHGRPTPAGAPSFTIANDRFVINGSTPVSMFAGEIHYSRVHPDLWDDRLARLRAMGLNAIQTYVPWNFHETTEGVFDFGDVEPSRNLPEFLRIAQQHGLMVNVRAGPYMCGEWEFGGLPAWLLRNGTIALRTYAQPYISFVDRYWARLLAEIKPLLFANGGPVVMVQCENEFGSYGDVSTNPLDKQYIEHLVEFAGNALGGADQVVLYTTDGGNTGFMERGSLKGDAVFTTGDGCGGNPAAVWAAQKQPVMILAQEHFQRTLALQFSLQHRSHTVTHDSNANPATGSTLRARARSSARSSTRGGSRTGAARTTPTRPRRASRSRWTAFCRWATARAR